MLELNFLRELSIFCLSADVLSAMLPYRGFFKVLSAVFIIDASVFGLLL